MVSSCDTGDLVLAILFYFILFYLFFEKGFMGAGISKEVRAGGLLDPSPTCKAEETLETCETV
jgi:hypothetical protein